MTDDEIYQERIDNFSKLQKGEELMTPRQAESHQPTCAERIDAHYDNVMETLRMLWDAYTGAECPKCEGSGEINESKSNEDDAVIVECSLCKGKGELDEDSYSDEIGNLYEYGLSFDYCTADKNGPGYFRYQLSWGGPSDEFRIYADKINDYHFVVWKIEYWFLDWFDGAHKVLSGDNLKFMEELFDSFFSESGTSNAVYEQAMKDWEPEDDEEENEDD